MIVRSPIKIRTAMPAIWHISTGIKLPKSSENFSEIPRTAAPIRLIMAAEKAGIRIPLLQYAAAARYVSILTIKARKISLCKFTHLRYIV